MSVENLVEHLVNVMAGWLACEWVVAMVYALAG